MKRILIPTDFSENAEVAARFAISVFNQDEDEFILLNTFKLPDNPRAGFLANKTETLEKLSREDLEKFQERLKEEYPDLKLSIACRFGDLSEVINRMVKEDKIDYLAVGTKGASGIQEVLIGSNAYDIIHNVKVPTFVVPGNCTKENLYNVLFTADLRETNYPKTLSPLKYVLDQHDSKVYNLSIYQEPDEFDQSKFDESQALDQFFKDYEYSSSSVLNDNIEDGIEQFSDKIKADLVVLIHRKQGFFEYLFQKSTTRKIALHSTTPILVLSEDK